jgi:DNA ligase D-like protein (predicted 3'-phosphoesterase)
VPDQNKLSKYWAKRDFTKTTEPSGRTMILPSVRRRFVIQKHAATRLHYDLRLELDGVFKSWAVTKRPSLDPHDKRLAVEVENHPLEYGDFESTIPAGKYGGTVQLWDRGYWQPEGSETPQQGLANGDLRLAWRVLVLSLVWRWACRPKPGAAAGRMRALRALGHDLGLSVEPRPQPGAHARRAVIHEERNDSPLGLVG